MADTRLGKHVKRVTGLPHGYTAADPLTDTFLFSLELFPNLKHFADLFRQSVQPCEHPLSGHQRPELVKLCRDIPGALGPSEDGERLQYDVLSNYFNLKRLRTLRCVGDSSDFDVDFFIETVLGSIPRENALQDVSLERHTTSRQRVLLDAFRRFKGLQRLALLPACGSETFERVDNIFELFPDLRRLDVWEAYEVVPPIFATPHAKLRTLVLGIPNDEVELDFPDEDGPEGETLRGVRTVIRLVEEIVRTRKEDPGRFSTLHAVGISTAAVIIPDDSHRLSFKTDRHWPVIADMARALRAVGLAFFDQDGLLWQDAWTPPLSYSIKPPPLFDQPHDNVQSFTLSFPDSVLDTLGAPVVATEEMAASYFQQIVDELARIRREDPDRLPRL